MANLESVSPTLCKHLILWTGIMNNMRKNSDGELPTLAERIIAGSYLLLFWTMRDNDESVDEAELIRTSSQALGEKWHAA